MSDYAPQIVELRPMGIGDILDATFRLYKKYFVPFMVIALVAYLPYALYTVATGVIWPDPEIQVSDNPTPEELLRIMSAGSDAQRLAGRVGDIIFGIFVFPLIQAGMTFAISAAILGETVSAGGALSRAKSRMWAVLGTQILVNIVVFIGFILLFVPGIIFSLWFMIAVPVVVIEGLSGSGAMSRARELMRENLGKGFLLGLAVGALTLVVMFGCGFVIGMLPLPDPISQGLVMILQAVVLPFSTAAIVLLYYDLRVRKEAFDLERLSASVRSEPPMAMA